jgi:iron complex outermembrane recepter protein
VLPIRFWLETILNMGEKMNKPLQRVTVGMSVAAILGSATMIGYSPVALSAADQAGELEEIQVTGSRIVRRDFESSSPIVTVGSELLEQTSNIALEASLNKLPQFVPALSQLVTGDIQPTATNTPGIATANLRGFGANRNLVIIDGRRGMPINSSLAIDLNSIPSAAIDRVEVITGGASSTYGADAVGGVVNFITKKNFQGLQVDVQHGGTFIGDAEESRIAAIIGGNFSDDRGNVMVGAEYTKRGDAFFVDHPFYEKRFQDPTVAGTDFWMTETSAGFAATNRPTQTAVDSIFTLAERTAAAPNFRDINGNPVVPTVLNSHNFFFNDNGSLWSASSLGFGTLGAPTAASPSNPGGTYRYQDGLDGTFRKRQANNGLGQNELLQYRSTPMDRYSLFARGHFDLTEKLTAFVQGTLAQTKVDTLSQFSPAVGGWNTAIPYGSGRNCQSLQSINAATANKFTCQDADSFPGAAALGLPATVTSWAQVPTLPAYRTGGSAGLTCGPTGGCTNTQAYPVPAELAVLLNSRPNPNGTWNLGEVFDWLPRRGTHNNVTTYQIIAGLEGSLPVKDWTWEAYVSHGQSQTSTQISGVVSLDAYRTLVSAPNYGRGFVMTQNTNETINGLPQGGNFAGARVTCTSGIPITQSFAVSQDCMDALSYPLQNRQNLTQTVYEANMQGGLFEWWAGEVRFAAGAGYRENQFEYQTDGLTSINNFITSAVGIFPLGDSKGETSVSEIYGELLIPLLKDVPLIKNFELELGYRFSDYDPTGGVSTYKALASWTVNDYIRLRGGYQFASRAPNIGELFSGRTQIFGGAPATIDLCSERAPTTNSLASLSANPAANPTGAAAARTMCEAMMGANGANTYYVVNASTQPTGGVGGLYQSQGNPQLEEEKAKSWTAGLVIGSPFQNALLSGLRFTADWYSIALEDAITLPSGNVLIERCFSRDTNPSLDPDNLWCQTMPRNPDSGFVATTNGIFSNEASLKTSGVDLQLDWRAAFSDMGLDSVPGTLLLNVQASFVDYFKERQTPTAIERDFKGYVGANLPTALGGAGVYDYRLFTTLTYSAGDFGLSLRYRYLPSIQDTDELFNPGGTPGGNPLVKPIGSYNMFDLSGTWSINDMLQLRAGIDNLFDQDPPITGVNLVADQYNNMTGGSFNTAGLGTYDPLGRRYFVGLRATF